MYPGIFQPISFLSARICNNNKTQAPDQRRHLGDLAGRRSMSPPLRQPPPAHARHKVGGRNPLARHRAERTRLRGRRNIGVGSKRVATSWGSPTRTASTGGRAEHRWREKPQTTGRHYAPCHRSLQTTQYTYGGEAWATMGYPHSIHRFHVKRSVWHWIHVQSRFRDTFASSIPDILGACESSQRAAFVGDTLIRTAGIVGS